MIVGDWTENLAQLFPEREAVFDVRTGARVSYPQLHARVRRMARVLARLEVAKGDRVAVLANNRLEHLDALFACARLGALYVPLNWRLAAPELAFLLQDAEPRVLLYDDEHAAVAEALCRDEDVRGTSLDALEQPGGLYALVEDDDTPAQADLDLEDPWCVLYTSGTTGRPKGALLPYRQVAFNAMNTHTALDLTSADRTITYTPMFHTGALHVLTTPLLTAGGSLVLTDGFDPAQCLELAEREGVTLLFGVPTTFEMMAASERFERTDLSKVRVALCGGAPCPISLIERYAARGVRFKQGYGLTEVGPNCLNLRVEDIDRKRGAAGRPNLHIAAKVIDDDGRTLAGPGRGELCLAGPCVCLGYWRRADATAASFTPDGFFRTGDVVERDDEGFFTIVDRKKDMFISGGENVYPAEVEKALADHPRVAACAVVGVPDDKWGEVGRAYVEGAALQGVDLGGLKAWLRERLAAYKVPKQFVALDALPRNASGKVEKHLLRDAGGAA
jgi:fatty-acyl-CoA synthase